MYFWQFRRLGVSAQGAHMLTSWWALKPYLLIPSQEGWNFNMNFGGHILPVIPSHMQLIRMCSKFLSIAYTMLSCPCLPYPWHQSLLFLHSPLLRRSMRYLFLSVCSFYDSQFGFRENSLGLLLPFSSALIEFLLISVSIGGSPSVIKKEIKVL